MDKTKVDEMLIRMIAPKLKEIEERFSAGKGLDNDDVNTLLLKSQFNHINHLDMRIDGVTADVAALKLDFAGLKIEFAELKSEFAGLKSEFAELKSEFAGLKSEFAELKSEFSGLRADVKIEISNLKTDVQQAINRNMQWSIGLIAFIVTALKVIDMIWGGS